MENKKEYKYSCGKDVNVAFDENGYITKAQGFQRIMWASNTIDKDLIGKHIDELADMLKKEGSNETYLEFEANVHISVLKKMLQNTNK